MSADVVLLTGRTMPREVPENALLIDALAERGVRAELLPWDEPDTDWSRFGLAVVRTTWDYWDRREEFLTALRGMAARTLLRNPPELVAWNSHKGYLVELARAGVPVVPTRLVPQGSDDATALAALGAFGPRTELVVKPAVSAGARGALRAHADDPAVAAHLAELTGRQDALVQPLATSVLSRGETSLVYFGGEFSHAVRKAPAAGEYRIHLHHGGSLHPHTPDDAELAVAAAALAAAPWSEATEYARVDLVQGADGTPQVMELELIEPELFLEADEGRAVGRYADRLAALV
ncbi:ATP-grasp domain-containing protein [Streptacidiphilus monticola]|uniref:RimK family alpha-L-glutamate ligase n=1 Tax=Streptacidiphilus monticola TaxID=2161674 RepID=A0ABW1G314_9ACTN